jgi:hypothetical protein
MGDLMIDDGFHVSVLEEVPRVVKTELYTN